MKLSPSGLMEHARSDDGRKQIRYAIISIVFVPLGQVLIQIFVHFVHNNCGDGNFVAASIISAVILTLPNFYANKRWVWRDTNRDNLRTQILVFWVAAMLGVALATLLTWWAQSVQPTHACHSHAVVTLGERALVFLAQLVGFGVVWVGRYIILDKWLFKVTHHGDEPTEEELEELHHEFPI
jgi:putative flippase GtrA